MRLVALFIFIKQDVGAASHARKLLLSLDGKHSGSLSALAVFGAGSERNRHPLQMQLIQLALLARGAESLTSQRR